MPSNKDKVGAEYPGARYTMTAEAAKAYAAATDDASARYPAIAPPMAAVIWTLAAAAMPVMDESLIGDTSRVLRLLHGEQEIRWHRAAKPGDVLDTKATVKSIEDKGSGELVEITTRTVDASGAPVVDMTWGFFIRYSKKELAALGRTPDGAKKDDAAPRATAAPRAAEWELAWTVAKDQPARYAEASGDRNPIHVDDAMAKMAGLDGVILHGLCTMAFAQRALIEKVGGGDPARLARMRVRFTKPVYPGETLTWRGWSIEKSADGAQVGFEVVNAAGEPVLKDGSATIGG